MGLPFAGWLGSFTSRAASETIGFGVGVALAEVLRPEATQLGYEGWRLDPARLLDVDALARMVAENVDAMDDAADDALSQGYERGRFDKLVRVTRRAPGIGELLRMRRRKTISADDFAHGLRKGLYEPRWDEHLAELQHERLEPAVVATTVQRGILPNEGILPVGPPTERGKVPPMPMVDLDPFEEAEASGIGAERLKAMARIVGLPPAPGELLQLVNRGHIDETDYFRGIAEGNTRNEWAPFLLHLRRRILTPHEYAEAHLRGWIGPDAMHEGAALSGLRKADTDLLHKLLGRPLTVHQVQTGLARGGKYDGPVDHIPEAFIRSLEQGSVRPEWYNTAYANRHTLPSAFVVRALIKDGTLTAHEGEELFLHAGWPPDLAQKAASVLGDQGGASPKGMTAANLLAEYEGLYLTPAEFKREMVKLGYGDHEVKLYAELADARRVRSSRNARINRIKAQYVNHSIGQTTARQALKETKIPDEAQGLLMDEWEAEREVNVSRLTPAQIKKAYKSGLYTKQYAIDLLENRGYTTTDATTLLEE